MKSIVICSGGSGGHVFPAIALCDMLKSENYKVLLLTDERGNRFCNSVDFPVKVMPKISSAPKDIIKTMWNALKITVALVSAWRKKKPDLVIGFGGALSVLPIFLSKRLGIKTLIHEQNVVFGRANKFLEKIADIVAVGFPDGNEKHIEIETPVRKKIFEKFAAPYSFKDKKKFVISVLGGSQTADVFASVVPYAFKLLNASDCKKIKIIQQVSENRIPELKAIYESLGIENDLRPFISDVESVITDSCLVISRAGASTLAELGTIGRPAILVPYPYAGEHQKHNAEYFENLGAAWVISENNFSPKSLALKLEGLLYNTDQLVIAAVNMLKSRKPSSNKRFVEFCKKIINEE